jgi:hypothetical protein
MIELIVVEVKKSMFTYEHLVEGCSEATVDMQSIWRCSRRIKGAEMGAEVTTDVGEAALALP